MLTTSKWVNVSRAGLVSDRRCFPRHAASIVLGSTEHVTAVAETLDFSGMGLSDEMLDTLAQVGYQQPSPIQLAFIPRAIEGADCIGQARTGTGKTAAFVIPILESIDFEQLDPQALILTPTRELSEQVAHEVDRLSQGHGCEHVCCVGGKNLHGQMETLRRGVHIVIGTPGRVIDLMNRGSLRLNRLTHVVLDEADRMLDIGFRPDIERILRQCPTDRQTMLLSATLPPPVERLAQRYMRSPERIDLSEQGVAVDTIEQFYVTVNAYEKFSTLVRVLMHEKPRQVIVFCRTKRGADALYAKLVRRLQRIAVIHGDLPQTARDRAMRQFRSAEIRMLIATDVVGRGIDVTGVSHIINYDIPEFCDDYVHRIGRTGRLSSTDMGRAITLVTRDEGPQLTSIEKRINMLIPNLVLPSNGRPTDDE